MKDFLFVLGSNWRLSIAELDNVLKYSKFKGKIKDYSANVAIVEFDNLDESKHYINELMELQFILGGTQKIAKIFNFIDIQTVNDAFPMIMDKYKYARNKRKQILQALNDTLEKIFHRIKNEDIFFAVSIYPDLFDNKYYKNVLVKHFLPFLNKNIMALLKKKGAKKSLYFEYPEKNIKSGNLNPIFPHHLITYGLFNKDRAEIIFGFTEEGVYIARTFTADDPNFKKKIDEQRPSREFKSSISPKLSLMMLNFLNLFTNRNEKKILDPFLGNGTIVLFALIEDFRMYGSDMDPEKVKNSIRNIHWLLEELEEPLPPLLSENFKVSKVENLSTSFENDFFDGICTEPDLGPFYVKKPYYNEVIDLFQQELEPLYESFFKEASKILKPKARICIISPIINTIDGGDVQMDINKFAAQNKFTLIPIIDKNRIINKSNVILQFKKKHVTNLIDAKKGQIIKRKIYVFEKN
ncbi:MAG: hypothetical protein EU539_07020 [Promethearchaeota archaeon]|nr:MAG: hypothetical protein EU539_07020 [Candidatus Lokiarchaeota archaeon]